MAYKEIVTKTIKNKSKKSFTNNYKVQIDNINNVLGCWVINHKFDYTIDNNSIYVIGEFDINIWYSYNDNSKTNVIIENIQYKDLMGTYENGDEIVIKCLNQPNVIDAVVDNGLVNLTVDKTLGIEIIGDASLKVNVEDELNDYQELINESDIKEDYLQ